VKNYGSLGNSTNQLSGSIMEVLFTCDAALLVMLEPPSFWNKSLASVFVAVYAGQELVEVVMPIRRRRIPVA
jgi:hypothetical protein